MSAAAFATQLHYSPTEDGKIERRADDSLQATPLTVIAAASLHPLLAARMLRRLADELEAGR